MHKIKLTISFLIPVIGLTALMLTLAGCKSQNKGETEELTTIEDNNKAFIQAYWNL